MEYPGAVLTRPFRRAIFILMVAIFFTAAPLIILYTMGYRYDFSRGIVRSTGALSIDIKPENAQVYINGDLIKSQMPVRLKNIVPGKYQIKIDAGEKYYSWEKEVDVKIMETVYVKEISLIQKNDPEIIKEADINTVSLSPNNKFLVFDIDTQKNKEVWLYNLENNNYTLLTNLAKKDTIKFTWAKKNNYLAITPSTTPYNQVILLNADTPDKQIDLVKIAKNPITKFQLRDSSAPEIFYSIKSKIFEYNLDNTKNTALINNTFLDWELEAGQIWTLGFNTTTGYLDITQDALGYSSVFQLIKEKRFSNYKFVTAKNKNILLKNPINDEMLLLSKNKQTELSGNELKISSYNDWWLIWTPWELTTYIENDEPILLNRSGEQLKKVIPLDKYNTLGLVWNNKMTVLFPYYFVGHDLINTPIYSADANTTEKVLYFAGEINGKKGLWKLNY